MAWDISGLVLNQNFDLGAIEENGVKGFHFNTDGTKMFLVSVTATFPDVIFTVFQYDLSIGFDISTAVSAGSFAIPTTDEANLVPGSLVFSETGDRFFYLHQDDTTFIKSIRSYTMGTLFDVTTASVSSELGIDALVGATNCFNFSLDGLHLYVGRTSGSIVQLDLATAWDITTASVTSNTFSPAEPIVLWAISIGDAGTRLFVDDGAPSMYQYTLSTAYDISTAVYDTLTFDFPWDPVDVGQSSTCNFFIDLCSTRLYHLKQVYLPGPDAIVNSIDEYDMGTAACPVSTPVLQSGGTVKASGSPGVVRKAVSSVSGLHQHSVGAQCTTVKALVDGNVIDLEICNGEAQFPTLATRAHIGIPYTTDIELLNIEAPQGTAQGMLKKITDVVVRFYKSRLPLIGPNFFDMVQMKQRENENYGEATEILTGDKRTNIPPSWNSNGRIAFRMRDPVPLTILAVVPELEIEDD